MNKNWYQSMTFIGILAFTVCVLLDYLLGNYGPPEIYNQVEPVIVPVKAAATFTTVIGLRRAVGVNDTNAKPPTIGESK